MHECKVGLVGAGNVASALLVSLILRGTANEIVVVNRRAERARGIVTDAQYGAAVTSPVKLTAGDYSDLAGAQIVLITAGTNEKSGGATDRKDPAGRLRLFESNAAIFAEIVPQIVKAAPKAILLVVTDPPDPLADLTRKLAGHDRVISSGTLLDTMRFKFHLARESGVAASGVDALVLGEHGTSQVFIWSTARIGEVPIQSALGLDDAAMLNLREKIEREVRYANITIIEGTGASQLGIGMVAARIVDAILRDERTVLPVGVFNRHYAATLSLPTVVGKEGGIRVYEPPISNEEREAIERSAEKLRGVLDRARF